MAWHERSRRRADRRNAQRPAPSTSSIVARTAPGSSTDHPDPSRIGTSARPRRDAGSARSLRHTRSHLRTLAARAPASVRRTRRRRATPPATRREQRRHHLRCTRGPGILDDEDPAPRLHVDRDPQPDRARRAFGACDGDLEDVRRRAAAPERRGRRPLPHRGSPDPGASSPPRIRSRPPTPRTASP